jgi:membrane-associated phospholipid phosphatase
VRSRSAQLRGPLTKASRFAKRTGILILAFLGAGFGSFVCGQPIGEYPILTASLPAGNTAGSDGARKNTAAELEPDGIPRLAQASSSETSEPSRTSESETPSEPKRPLPKRILDAFVEEATRYLSDAVAFVRAPGSWDGSDWRRAAGAGASLTMLFLADESIDGFARRQRSHFTDRVSGATTWIGGGGGFDVPFVLLAGGLAFSDANTRDMGRDALEACLFSEYLTKGLKNAIGRERPFETKGETTFKLLSSHDSFPSAHTTQAFALASVVAMRSDGWLVPTLAYTAATVVAFDRVNDRVHFASDVFAGALVGTVTGRFLVARHRRQKEPKRPRVELEIIPIRSGLAARIRF